jgi:polysaccharide export outer membrane protein
MKKIIRIFLLFTLIVSIYKTNQAYSQENYVLGPEDEIEIRVWDHDDLFRKLRIGLDGQISFPFVGEIKAKGHTLSQVQRDLEQRLSKGYINNPHVSVIVTEFKSHKYFVVGKVAKPGTYPLTRSLSLVQAISLAGGLSPDISKDSGAPVAIIVRALPGELPNRPIIPSQPNKGHTITVSLSEAMSGDSKQNLEINNGDTIYIPQLFYYVTGEVKRPGRYPYERDMNVLMAITTAEGFTDKAASRRTYVIRAKPGGSQEHKVKLNDPIEPLDTIVVPESFF